MSEQDPFPHIAPVDDSAASAEALRLRDLAAARAAADQPAPRKRTGLGLIIGGAGVLVLLGLGSGVAYAMNAHGDYPYQHLASGASVYAQLNMAPSMMQKMQLASFLSKMPDLGGKDVQEKASSPTSVAQAILDQLAPDNGIKDYSWAGDRYAVVAYGDMADIQSSGKGAIVMQVKDQQRAVTAIRSGLQQGSDLQVATLDDGYVVVGEAAGVKAAAAKGSHLSDDKNFKSYTEAGDPLSYWVQADGSTAAGGVHAGWSSLELTGSSTGQPLGVSADAESRNLQLTGQNSVADPLFNFGFAEPAKQLGPDSPAGKSLLQAADAYAGDDAGQTRTQLETVVNALGDNVSVSANTKGARILLHGTTEAQVNSALASLGGPYSLQDLAGGSTESQLQVQDTDQGLLLVSGPVTASPTTLNKVNAGASIGQLQLSHLPKEMLDKVDPAKLGSVNFSVASTADGSKMAASWDLP